MYSIHTSSLFFAYILYENLGFLPRSPALLIKFDALAVTCKDFFQFANVFFICAFIIYYLLFFIIRHADSYKTKTVSLRPFQTALYADNQEQNVPKLAYFDLKGAQV